MDLRTDRVSGSVFAPIARNERHVSGPDRQGTAAGCLQGRSDPSMTRGDRSSHLKGSIFPISIRLNAALVALYFASVFTISRADDLGGGPPAPPRDAVARDVEARRASLESLLPELSPIAPGADEEARLAATASVPAPRAVARMVGTAAPGLRVTLDGSGSTGQPRWYRWVQVQGPPTPLDGEDLPAATLTVPSDSSSLAYLLLVGNSAGADVANLAMPVESKRQSAAGRRAARRRR